MAISDGFIINGEDLVALADEELVRLWQSNALPNDESIKYHINACTRTRVAMGERPSTGITERLAGSWLPIASPGFPKQEEAPDVEEGTIVLTDTSGRESLHRTQRHFIRWLSSALFCAITIFKKFLASEPNKGLEGSKILNIQGRPSPSPGISGSSEALIVKAADGDGEPHKCPIQCIPPSDVKVKGANINIGLAPWTVLAVLVKHFPAAVQLEQLRNESGKEQAYRHLKNLRVKHQQLFPHILLPGIKGKGYRII